MDSLKEALDKHDKIFIAQGVFGYDDYDDLGFIFDEDDVLEDAELADEYYDKYKFSLAGYGIYLDKYLNLEPGYFTIEAPPSGHGPGSTTFHDFKDAKDRDVIKEKIDSEIDYDRWKIFYTDSINYINENNPINPKLLELTKPIIQFIFDESFDFKEKENILNDLIRYTKRIAEGLPYFEEDCPEDTEHISNKSIFLKDDSPEATKIVGECPNCGNEVSKVTKNDVAIKCSQCGHTFWF